MRTLGVQKLDVSVGRGPKSWTCPYVFNGLQATDVNTSLGTAGRAGLNPAIRHPSRELPVNWEFKPLFLCSIFEIFFCRSIPVLNSVSHIITSASFRLARVANPAAPRNARLHRD